MMKLVGDSNQFEAAIVLYSTGANVEMNFSTKFNLQHFYSTIDNLPHHRGLTRIDKALITASKYIFTNNTFSRRLNVPMIAILTTDGRTAHGYPDFVPVSNASQPLKQRGVRIFTVGIGKSVSIQELVEITERSNDVFFAESFYTLLNTVDNLVSHVLSAIGKGS